MYKRQGHAVQRLIVRQQVVEIITVALGAGHAARTGVRLFQQAIVALYGLEGEPVGSSVLANYFDMAVSLSLIHI